jgi:hypothetical protein
MRKYFKKEGSIAICSKQVNEKGNERELRLKEMREKNHQMDQNLRDEILKLKTNYQKPPQKVQKIQKPSPGKICFNKSSRNKNLRKNEIQTDLIQRAPQKNETEDKKWNFGKIEKRSSSRKGRNSKHKDLQGKEIDCEEGNISSSSHLISVMNSINKNPFLKTYANLDDEEKELFRTIDSRTSNRTTDTLYTSDLKYMNTEHFKSKTPILLEDHEIELNQQSTDKFSKTSQDKTCERCPKLDSMRTDEKGSENVKRKKWENVIETVGCTSITIPKPSNSRVSTSTTTHCTHSENHSNALSPKIDTEEHSHKRPIHTNPLNIISQPTHTHSSNKHSLQHNPIPNYPSNHFNPSNICSERLSIQSSPNSNYTLLHPKSNHLPPHPSHPQFNNKNLRNIQTLQTYIPKSATNFSVQNIITPKPAIVASHSNVKSPVPPGIIVKNSLKKSGVQSQPCSQILSALASHRGSQANELDPESFEEQCFNNIISAVRHGPKHDIPYLSLNRIQNEDNMNETQHMNSMTSIIQNESEITSNSTDQSPIHHFATVLKYDDESNKNKFRSNLKLCESNVTASFYYNPKQHNSNPNTSFEPPNLKTEKNTKKDSTPLERKNKELEAQTYIGIPIYTERKMNESTTETINEIKMINKLNLEAQHAHEMDDLEQRTHLQNPPTTNEITINAGTYEENIQKTQGILHKPKSNHALNPVNKMHTINTHKTIAPHSNTNIKNIQNIKNTKNCPFNNYEMYEPAQGNKGNRSNRGMNTNPFSNRNSINPMNLNKNIHINMNVYSSNLNSNTNSRTDIDPSSSLMMKDFVKTHFPDHDYSAISAQNPSLFPKFNNLSAFIEKKLRFAENTQIFTFQILSPLRDEENQNTSEIRNVNDFRKICNTRDIEKIAFCNLKQNIEFFDNLSLSQQDILLEREIGVLKIEEILKEEDVMQKEELRKQISKLSTENIELKKEIEDLLKKENITKFFLNNDTIQNIIYRRNNLPSSENFSNLTTTHNPSYIQVFDSQNPSTTSRDSQKQRKGILKQNQASIQESIKNNIDEGSSSENDSLYKPCELENLDEMEEYMQNNESGEYEKIEGNEDAFETEIAEQKQLISRNCFRYNKSITCVNSETESEADQNLLETQRSKDKIRTKKKAKLLKQLGWHKSKKVSPPQKDKRKSRTHLTSVDFKTQKTNKGSKLDPRKRTHQILTNEVLFYRIL